MWRCSWALNPVTQFDVLYSMDDSFLSIQKYIYSFLSEVYFDYIISFGDGAM